MDLDFDDQPSDLAAPAAKAGARFKPKGRPQPKKKQVSTDVAKEKLSTQSEDSVSLDESSAFPNKDLTSETIVPESWSCLKTGARFKPEGGAQPKKERVSFSLPTDVAKEKLSTQNEDPVSLDESPTYPNKDSTSESGTNNQSEENVDICSGGIKWPMRPSILRVCTKVDLEGKRCDDGTEAASTFHDDPRTQESAAGDFVTPATDEDIHAQTKRMQTEEEECSLDMESLDIVQEEGTTSTYVQHTGKLQPKPRLFETVIEEPESHYPADDIGYYSMGTNESEFTVNVESRNDFITDTTFYEDFQEEERSSIPEGPRETVPEMEARSASGGFEHEEQVVEEEGTGKESSKKRKSKRGRKWKTTSQDEPNTSSENPEKKKFKHASRRQKKRTLEKELLETPDHEIRNLPIRDMLLLVEYKERLEKKEAKGATVGPPTQESSNTNASGNQYYSQGFDEEDEFAIEDGENQEVNVVKPDSPVNYQTYMNKTPRTRWSKEDTELFYEGIREFGSNLSMVQQLFPDRTRQQIKLKFKLEERRFPLKLNDALSSRSKHLTHFQNVIKKLQQEAAAAKEAEEEDEEQEEAGAEAEVETTDVPENEEPAKSEETERAGDGVAGVKESDGGDECDDEADDDYWDSYKSDM